MERKTKIGISPDDAMKAESKTAVLPAVRPLFPNWLQTRIAVFELLD